MAEHLPEGGGIAKFKRPQSGDPEHLSAAAGAGGRLACLHRDPRGDHCDS
jgi:hypothetical protein